MFEIIYEKSVIIIQYRGCLLQQNKAKQACLYHTRTVSIWRHLVYHCWYNVARISVLKMYRRTRHCCLFYWLKTIDSLDMKWNEMKYVRQTFWFYLKFSVLFWFFYFMLPFLFNIVANFNYIAGISFCFTSM